MIHNHTLPRTKNYTCLNKKCKTHNDESIKEAVFFRELNSYKVKYVCTVLTLYLFPFKYDMNERIISLFFSEITRFFFNNGC